MARSHGKILVGVWVDPDFNDLAPIEQWAKARGMETQ